MRIDTMDKWIEVAAMLSADGFQLWQTQYDTDDSHGYIARFDNFGAVKRFPSIEVVTFSEDVRNAIIRYSPEVR